MYQIPSSRISPETKEKLTVIQHRIDDLMIDSKSNEFKSVEYLNTTGHSATVMRDLGEYSVMTDKVFRAQGNLFESATTTLAFNGNFDIVEAGIRLYTANGNEAAFMGTAPEQMLGFVAMIDTQLEFYSARITTS